MGTSESQGHVPASPGKHSSSAPETSIVSGLLGAVWLVVLGSYALALIAASATNVQCSDKVGLDAEVSAWPLGYQCREQFEGGAVSERPGPVTVGLQVFLIATPVVLWWSAGNAASPVVQRRVVAQALVFAGIGLGACALVANAAGSTGLAAVDAVLGVGLLGLGASYRHRTREVELRTTRSWADVGMVAGAIAAGLALTVIIMVWASG